MANTNNQMRLMHYEYNHDTGEIQWHQYDGEVMYQTDTFYIEDNYIFYNESVMSELDAKIELLKTAIIVTKNIIASWENYAKNFA